MDHDLIIQIRKARSKFAAMAATYSLGVFNDNFFKWAAIGVTVGMEEWFTALFTLPFILFAPQAGWLADRFPKRNVVILAKVLEMIAMLCGAVAIIYGNVAMIAIVLTIMALQSTIFGPSLNGSIPELYPASYVTTANAMLKVVVTLAILLGTALAGHALELEHAGWEPGSFGRFAVAAVIVGIAVLGVAGSFFVPRRPGAGTTAKCPKNILLHSLQDLWEIRKDKYLKTILIVDVFIWFVGSLQMQIISKMCDPEHFNWGRGTASNLMLSELVGVAVGGLIAAWIAQGPRWYKVLPLPLIILGLTAIPVAIVPLLGPELGLMLMYPAVALMGIAGGIVMVPCESFIQVRPAPDRKGRVIAAAGCAAFISMLFSAGLLALLRLFISASPCFIVITITSISMGIWLWITVSKKEFGDA
ncbi:MAG: MFS transporter [Phycisphaerales bacterium]|jgi:acyl-[acyl-carrier-protein]-phospholipid O-acyltransferase / long-chain-fatty-acid--[acyl-carrier-protein] ligase|nr:MFS transporter [Phycisphaerales bacterium]